MKLKQKLVLIVILMAIITTGVVFAAAEQEQATEVKEIYLYKSWGGGSEEML